MGLLDSVGAASELGRVAGASGEVRSFGRGPAVRAAFELGVLAAAALAVRALGDGDPIRTATELVSITRAALEVRTVGRCESVGAAAVRSELASAALVIRTSGGGRVVRTATEARVLAAAAVQIGTSGGRHVVRTTSEARRETATLLIGTVSRGRVIPATAISGILAECSASGVVRSESGGRAVRAAAKVRGGAVVLIDDTATLEVRAGRSGPAVRATAVGGIRTILVDRRVREGRRGLVFAGFLGPRCDRCRFVLIASFEVRSGRRLDAVRTAAVGRSVAASEIVLSTGGGLVVGTAAELGLVAGLLAALEVVALGDGESVRTAAEEGLVAVRERTAVVRRAGGRRHAVRTAAVDRFRAGLRCRAALVEGTLGRRDAVVAAAEFGDLACLLLRYFALSELVLFRYSGVDRADGRPEVCYVRLLGEIAPFVGLVGQIASGCRCLAGR